MLEINPSGNFVKVYPKTEIRGQKTEVGTIASLGGYNLLFFCATGAGFHCLLWPWSMEVYLKTIGFHERAMPDPMIFIVCCGRPIWSSHAGLFVNSPRSIVVPGHCS